jgi:hypothetical protein
MVLLLVQRSPWALASGFQFHDHFTDGRTPWTVISSSQGFYLNTGQHKNRTNTYQTSMPCVGLELAIPASERAKTVHALDRSATVTGSHGFTKTKSITANLVTLRNTGTRNTRMCSRFDSIHFEARSAFALVLHSLCSYKLSSYDLSTGCAVT